MIYSHLTWPIPQHSFYSLSGETTPCHQILWSFETRRLYINTLRPRLRQNGHHFADNIFKCILFNGNALTLTEFHWGLFLRTQSTINQHWFRQWLGAKLAKSHYLKQWWPSSMVHIYVIWPPAQWVKKIQMTLLQRGLSNFRAFLDNSQLLTHILRLRNKCKDRAALWRAVKVIVAWGISFNLQTISHLSTDTSQGPDSI